MCQINLTSERLMELYAGMLRIRVFEDRVSVMYKTGEIPGFIHLYNGEEAVATGVCSNLKIKDVITSTHRGHGHALAKGCRSDKTMAELYGKRDGYSGGRGGSMHIYAMEYGLLGTNGMVGGGIGLAVGAGLAFRNLGQNNVAVAFFGDGASNMGIFYESLNLAAILKLPVIFVCENNLYATATRLETVACNPEIATRAEAFKMPGIAVDGNDVIAVYNVAAEAIRRALNGEGPTLIEAQTYRFFGHHQGEPLYGTYRTREEVEAWKQKCPIVSFRKRLITEFKVQESELDTVDAMIKKEIDDAVDYARNCKYPEAKDVGKYLFSEV